MQTRNLKCLAACVAVLAFGCDGGAPSEEESSDDALVGGALTVGADLFVNTCVPADAGLVCSPMRMSIRPGITPRTRTTKLGEVRQGAPGGTIARVPGAVLHGSTVDRRGRQVFWHVGCDPSYHVTNIDTGVTRTFAIDLARLGIADAPHAFCLAEWAFDERRNAAIALGGFPIGGRSSIAWALTLDAQGGATVLWDLRGQLDDDAAFLHPFQTETSFDREHDQILAPFVTAAGGEQVLSLDLTTGRIVRNGTVGCWIQAFFDEGAKKPTFFDCGGPGWNSTVAAPPERRIAIPRDALTARGIDQGGGGVGGGYDPVGENVYMLMRPIAAQTNPFTRFYLGVGDLTNDRWRGFIATDLRVGDAPGNGSTSYVMTELVPRR